MGSLGKPVDMNTSLIHLACLLGIAVAQYKGGYGGGGYGGGKPEFCMPASGEMNGKIIQPIPYYLLPPALTKPDASACAEYCTEWTEDDCQAWSFNTAATRDNCILYREIDAEDDCFNLRQEYKGWRSGRLY